MDIIKKEDAIEQMKIFCDTQVLEVLETFKLETRSKKIEDFKYLV